MKFKKFIYLTVAIISSLLLLIAIIFRNQFIPFFFQPTASTITPNNNVALFTDKKPTVVARNLQIPWEMVFLPDEDWLITERPGTLIRIGKQNQHMTINGVRTIGEGGLLGLTLAPDFKSSKQIYLYLTTEKNGKLLNEIQRYTYDEAGVLRDKKIIFSDIPAAKFHNGGRIKFGPDGYLYVTTGDALTPSSAQNKNSLAGKILRITKEGQPAPDNPFNNAVYAYGLRNPQGLAWDEQGHLWATDHGSSANDEVNLILPGKNYGWPEIEGEQTKKGMLAPILTSGGQETWAPAGMAYYQGHIFFGGLRGQTLFDAALNAQQNDINKLTAHYRNEYGRIRNVVHDSKGNLYFMTSNRDGRGWPHENDDRILRVHLK